MNLGKNSLCSKSGEYIGEVLIENPDYRLEEINFKGNRLEEYGLRRMIVAATKNPNIKKLNLGIISDFGLELLSHDLLNTNLRKLEFEEDEEWHDDEFQERKHCEFEAVHSSLVEELSKKFGPPRIAGVEDEFDTIPLCGVFPAAIWDTEGGELFLAVSHEDRETPILLAMGTA